MTKRLYMGGVVYAKSIYLDNTVPDDLISTKPGRVTVLYANVQKWKKSLGKVKCVPWEVDYSPRPANDPGDFFANEDTFQYMLDELVKARNNCLKTEVAEICIRQIVGIKNVQQIKENAIKLIDLLPDELIAPSVKGGGGYMYFDFIHPKTGTELILFVYDDRCSFFTDSMSYPTKFALDKKLPKKLTVALKKFSNHIP